VRLRRLVPANRAAAIVLAVLVALILVLIVVAWSLASWGTPGWGSPGGIARIGLGLQVLSDVAMNRAGYGFAAWTESEGDGVRVYVARFLPDSGWTMGTAVDDGVGFGRAKVAKLATSDRGDALAVWMEVGTPSALWANRFLWGQGWGSPTLLGTNEWGRIENFASAMDREGNGIVLWSQYEIDSVGNETGRLYERPLSTAAGWGSTSGLGTGWISDVVLLDDGTAVASWATTGGNYQMVSQRTVAGWWSSPAILNEGVSGYGRPSVCVAIGGTFLAVWEEWHDGGLSLWSSAYTPSSSWGAPQAVPGASGSVFGDLACTGHGDAVVISYSNPFGGRNLAVNWWNVTSGWSPPVLVGTPSAEGVQWPRVAVNEAGQAFAAWWQESGPHAFVSQFTKDSVSIAALRLEPDGGAVGPRVAIDSQGDAIVAWNQGSGTDSRVWANRYFVPNSGALRIPIFALSGVLVAAVGTASVTTWWWRRAIRMLSRTP
jgi:hypothetical protein